jgi:hypothetical protein
MHRNALKVAGDGTGADYGKTGESISIVHEEKPGVGGRPERLLKAVSVESPQWGERCPVDFLNRLPRFGSPGCHVVRGLGLTPDELARVKIKSEVRLETCGQPHAGRHVWKRRGGDAGNPEVQQTAAATGQKLGASPDQAERSIGDICIPWTGFGLRKALAEDYPTRPVSRHPHVGFERIVAVERVTMSHPS